MCFHTARVQIPLSPPLLRINVIFFLSFWGGCLIPQGDLLTFSPTLLFLGVTFLGGYYFFSTVWVPRLICTLKARAWLTTWSATLVVSSEAWPEIFLMVVQFGGLLFLVWSLGVPGSNTTRLTLTNPNSSSVAVFFPSGVSLTEVWSHERPFFLTPRGAQLTTLIKIVLTGGVSFSFGGKMWFSLREKLRSALMSEKAFQALRG